jgi:hypothetical protein
MFARFRWLLLAVVALLVVWYFTGGNQEIAWYRVVRAAARQGWDLSQADRFPHYGILYYASIFGIFLVFVVAAVRLVGIIAKKVLSPKSQ